MDKTDHEIIISLYWLLEDTELALIEFNSHQLQGPTRQMNNLGEKYLRLYGTLNAINLQMSALIGLFEIFKLPGKKEIKAKAKSLQAIELRHKIGAHSLDYVHASEVRNYRISRHSVDDNTLELIVLNKEGHERIHLSEALDEFQKFFHIEFYKACTSIIEKIIPGNATIKAELSRSMDLINETIKGGIVIEAEGMSTVIFIKESNSLSK